MLETGERADPKNQGNRDDNGDSPQRAEGDSTTPTPASNAILPKPLWNNTVTIAGVFLTAMATLLILTFALFSVLSPAANPYVDIVGYLILPTLLILGLFTIPMGILFKSWRLRRRDPEQRLAFRFPRIDLNDPDQRRVLKPVFMSFFIMLPVIGVSGYHGYHYTDSTKFCAKACHAPMEPQATTYEQSAHARVSCAECHIGEGAGWFVKSKLSGTRQVFAMLRDSYSRPIPPAIHHLRPARETCEHCHWPQKFYGAQLRRIVTFASDERNERHEIDMLLKIGGGDESTGRAEGIHLHMALEGRIEYVATDDKLQTIPWVKLTDEAGNERIFRSDGRPTSDPTPRGQVRNIDCMDCHNRPAHKFKSPQKAVNLFLEIGRIDPSLPFIKREATRVLSQPYPDKETALAQIGLSLEGYYRENHADTFDKHKADVYQAIDQVRDIYAKNFFAQMKVDWRTYPDNIGHKISSGCFRCHDGEHVDHEGKAISHSCDICHTFLNPVGGDADTAVIREGEFIHPIELVGVHSTLRCDQCHNGGVAPKSTCTGCHSDVADLRAGSFAPFPSLELPADPMADIVECDMCHNLKEPLNLAAIDEMCMECHEDEPETYEGMLTQWKNEADALLPNLENASDPVARRALESLLKAGPLHNMEATRAIARQLQVSPTPES